MKKNKFLTFVLSIIPGCGLMYLGYMKKGLQAMLAFAAACSIAIFFGGQFFYAGWLTTIFVILLPIIWFYQMFDSMHSVSRMKRLGIEFPEDDGFVMLKKFSPSRNSKIAKAAAFALIIFGGLGLIFGILNNLHNFIDNRIADYIYNAVHSALVPMLISAALIVGGVKLLLGNKKTADTGRNEEEEL